MNDDTLWHLIITKYYTRIYNNLFYQTNDQQLAEDITQETFAIAMRKAHQLKQTDKIFYWLIKIAQNLLNTTYRREKRSFPASDTWVLKELPDNSYNEIVDQLEKQTGLRKALTQLSPQQREMIVLFYYSDLKYQEIAEILKISDGTVKQQLFRARNKLRKILERK